MTFRLLFVKDAQVALTKVLSFCAFLGYVITIFPVTYFVQEIITTKQFAPIVLIFYMFFLSGPTMAHTFFSAWVARGGVTPP